MTRIAPNPLAPSSGTYGLSSVRADLSQVGSFGAASCDDMMVTAGNTSASPTLTIGTSFCEVFWPSERGLTILAWRSVTEATSGQGGASWCKESVESANGRVDAGRRGPP